jgi:uncharacterized UBP type Zn finger protein
MASACEHLDRVQVAKPETTEGCAECLRSGDRWVHLRVCRTCGEVGCCDSSPNHHASSHAAAAGHPIATSMQPGESWSWCFVDRVAFDIPDDQGASSS